MRKVVDSNFLRSSDLTAYLARSRSNEIVLTEFILMEQFKRNAAVTVRQSFDLCSRYASQVIVLKRTPEILRLATRGSGLAQRMIDKSQTAAFPDFCSMLKDGSGTSRIDAHIRQREAESSSHMAVLLDDCKHMKAIFKRISTGFTTDELAEMRVRRPFRRTTQFKLIDTFFEESKRLYLASGVEPQFWPATKNDALNSFPFRYALCITLLYMRWIRDGEPDRTAEKHRNDVVDANTAAHATYFRGVLSKDGKLNGVHIEARHIIGQMGGYVGVGQ